MGTMVFDYQQCKERSIRLNKFTKTVFVVGLVALPMIAAFLSFGSTSAAPVAQQGNVERGAYVFALAGGCGCHQGQAGFLAGGRAPNITPDPTTGIGNWTEQQIVDAIRLGRHPSGKQLGTMPFDAFSQIADQDAYDLAAYLKSIPPIQNEVIREDQNLPAYTPATTAPATAPTSGVERGGYIVNVLAHCTGCHTPNNEDGTLDRSRLLAGGEHPRFGSVPNLTPNGQGFGAWTEEQIVAYLKAGTKPDGSGASETMGGMITSAFSTWTDDDAKAVVAYLKSIPAVGGEQPAETPTPAPMNEYCFTETSFCISGTIRDYWEGNGGLPVFGYPTGPQHEETIEGQSYQVQMFERNRLEIHPENMAPYHVLLGRLGAGPVEAALEAGTWAAPAKEQPKEGCVYFEQTGWNVCGSILEFYRSQGLEVDGKAGFSVEDNKALFGLPLTPEVKMEIGGQQYSVQWFERARFELHPENPAPYDVQLGLLGTEGFQKGTSTPPTMMNTGSVSETVGMP